MFSDASFNQGSGSIMGNKLVSRKNSESYYGAVIGESKHESVD